MKAHPQELPRSESATRRSTVFLGWALGALALTSCATQSASVQAQGSALSSEKTSLWAEHISAPKTELAWEQIPWRPSFLTGLREAAAAEKPVLLWVMNGHPLGCT